MQRNVEVAVSLKLGSDADYNAPLAIVVVAVLFALMSR